MDIMTKQVGNHELVDSIYAIAMEPERFRELIDIWQDRLREASSGTMESIDSFAFLEQHLSRAETILSVMTSNEDMLPKPLQEKLNSEPQAMVALTPDGIVGALNPAAAILFDIDEDTKVSDFPISQDAKEVILKEIRRLSQEDAQDTPGLFRMERADKHTPLLATFSTWITSGGRRFILLKTSDFIWPEYLNPLIENAFGLTKAETTVVKLIVEGSSVDDISKIRGTSIQTVRSQIKSIYAKTSTKTQSEFIRMAIGLTSLQLVEKDVLTGAYQRPSQDGNLAYPLPEHRRMLTLPDGRLLDYAIFGPKNGKPCLFHHNEYFGDVWPQELAQYALQKNLRIIAPARPYYGRSTPYPKGVINQDQFAEDLNFLLGKLGIERAVHISQTAGGKFCLAYANKYMDKIVAVVGVAPMLPFGTEKHEESMPKMSRFMSTIINNHPQMLKFIAKSATMYHRRVGSRRYLETLIAQTDTDAAIINDTNNLDAIVQGLRLTAEHGYLGLYHDHRHPLADPRQNVLDIRCNIYAIIGTDENNTRAARADNLIAAGANITKIMADGGGDMLFFSHPKLIVDTLVEAWENA